MYFLNTEPPPCSQLPLLFEPFASRTPTLKWGRNTPCLGRLQHITLWEEKTNCLCLFVIVIYIELELREETLCRMCIFPVSSSSFPAVAVSLGKTFNPKLPLVSAVVCVCVCADG